MSVSSSNRSIDILRKLRVVLLAGILGGTGFLTYQVISLSFANQLLQRDYAEINDIKYGLFNVNLWKRKLAKIISQEVVKFEISAEDRATLKPLVEEQLSKLITNVYEQIRDVNARSFKGAVKQLFIQSFVDLEDIKQNVPEYANDALDLMQKPKTKAELRALLLEKVDAYFAQTYDKQSQSGLEDLKERWGNNDLDIARQHISAEIQNQVEEIKTKSWLVIGLAILAFVLTYFDANHLTYIEFFALIMVLMALLIAGVTIPMINLEAKITEMSFVLFDEPTTFNNQYLYFQSKSILDVFSVMFASPDLQMKGVGILLITFSVIFPLLKLSSSIAYLAADRLRDNRVISWFVHKSGKWSMADVMVIAIFLSYIGLNGIVANQFSNLQTTSEKIGLLTTNGTTLTPGFYLFFTYALLALFLPKILDRVTRRES